MSQFEESDADIWRGIDEVKFLLCKETPLPPHKELSSSKSE